MELLKARAEMNNATIKTPTSFIKFGISIAIEECLKLHCMLGNLTMATESTIENNGVSYLQPSANLSSENGMVDQACQAFLLTAYTVMIHNPAYQLLRRDRPSDVSTQCVITGGSIKPKRSLFCASSKTSLPVCSPDVSVMCNMKRRPLKPSVELPSINDAIAQLVKEVFKKVKLSSVITEISAMEFSTSLRILETLGQFKFNHMALRDKQLAVWIADIGLLKSLDSLLVEMIEIAKDCFTVMADTGQLTKYIRGHPKLVKIRPEPSMVYNVACLTRKTSSDHQVSESLI